MNIQALFKLIQIMIAAGSNPLVVKFVDNMVKGTSTKVDDWVWAVLRTILGGGSINDLSPALEDVQRKYDADPEDAKAPAPAPDLIIA